MRIFQYIFIGFIKAYQLLLSPVLRTNCRFNPTCSQYAIEAIRTHGAFYGTILAIKRIGRCHPWGGEGDDPVPGSEVRNQKSEVRNDESEF